MRYVLPVGKLRASAADPGDFRANSLGLPLDLVQFVQQRADTIVVGPL